VAYGQRRFFDWGNWLAVRPMDELPHWRVAMRREPDLFPRLRAIARERGYQLRRGRRVGDPAPAPAYRHVEMERMVAAMETYGDDQDVLTGRSRAAPRRSGRPFLFTAEEVADALRRAHGMKEQATRLLGCARSTVYNYIARYPEVMEAGDDAREKLLDEAELQIMGMVDRGFLPAVFFVLETLGAERGYGREVRGPEKVEWEEWMEELKEEMWKVYEEHEPRQAADGNSDDLDNH
jgi:hypothetical protein